MDLLAHLDPNGDPHLVAVLCEHLTSVDGSFWKVSIAGHGMIEVGFDKSLSRYLLRGQVLWIWGLTSWNLDMQWLRFLREPGSVSDLPAMLRSRMVAWLSFFPVLLDGLMVPDC